MKVEAWVFGILTLFALIVTPIYWLMSQMVTLPPAGSPAMCSR